MAVQRKPAATPRKPAVQAKQAPAKKLPDMKPAPAAPVASSPPAAPSAPNRAPRPASPAADGKPGKNGKKDKKATGDDPATSRKKMVRDSFTMPASDYALIALLKGRTLASGTSVKKSELLRAGLVALAAMPPAQLIGLVASMPAVKTGRPGKKKK